MSYIVGVGTQVRGNYTYPAGYIHRWRFAEVAGDILDVEGTNHITPALGTGLSFDGTDDSVSTGILTTGYDGGSAFTICGWYRRDFATATAQKRVIVKTGALGAIAIVSRASGVECFIKSNTTTHTLASTAAELAEGEWGWICLVFNGAAVTNKIALYTGAGVQAYIDAGTAITPDAVVTTGTVATVDFTDAAEFVFGERISATYEWGQCTLADWMWYAGAPASDAEIALLYRFQKPASWTNGHAYVLHSAACPDEGPSYTGYWTGIAADIVADYIDITGYSTFQEYGVVANTSTSFSASKYNIVLSAGHTATGFVGAKSAGVLEIGRKYDVSAIVPTLSGGGTPTIGIGSSTSARMTITAASGSLQTGSFIADSVDLYVAAVAVSGVTLTTAISVAIAFKGLTSSAGTPTIVYAIPTAYINTGTEPTLIPPNNSASSYGTYTPASGIAVGTDSFSLAGWFKVLSLSPSGGMDIEFFKLSGSGPIQARAAFTVTAPSNVCYLKGEVFTPYGQAFTVGEKALTANQAFHVALVVDRTARTVAVYLDGNPVYGLTNSSGHFNNDFGTLTLAVLGAENNEQHKVLALNDLAYYDRALTADEVSGSFQGWQV